jgi:hypothetical protein
MTPVFTQEHVLLYAMKMLHALLVIQIGELNMQKVGKLKKGEWNQRLRILFIYTPLARLLKPPEYEGMETELKRIERNTASAADA